MHVLDRLRRLRGEVEGLSARAVLNYAIFEIEHGADPGEVLREALSLAEKDLADLARVVKELRQLVKSGMEGFND